MQDRHESPSVEQDTHGNEDVQEQQQTHATTVETVEEVRRPSVIDARRDKRSDVIKCKYNWVVLIGIPTIQIWDTKFQIGILDFKTLVSTWILVKISNLEPWLTIIIVKYKCMGMHFTCLAFNNGIVAFKTLHQNFNCNYEFTNMSLS